MTNAVARMWRLTSQGWRDEAGVSQTDHGLLLGDGVFETIRTQGLHSVWLEDHVDRLTQSAAVLGIDVSMGLPKHDIRDFVATANVGGIGRLRLTLTAGSGPAGYRRGNEPVLMAHWWEYEPRVEPLRLVVSASDFVPDSVLNGIKHISYLSQVLANRQAVLAGCDDALLLNLHGHITETTTANIFVVKNDVVVTPPLTAGVLPGIARAKVIKNLGSDVRLVQMDLSLAEIREADEVFVTSSLNGVVPVRQIDEFQYGVVGPITNRLRAELFSWMEL
jgi:branched-subunit amino acid aminotransferase/4-amino-4-deoxychorismate lyase